MSATDIDPPQRASLRCTVATLDSRIGEHGIDSAVASEVLCDALFAHGAEAIGEAVQPDGSIDLTAGFVSAEAAHSAARALRTFHGDLVVSLAVDDAPAFDWVAAQRDGIHPTTIGEVHIRAPWHPPINDEACLEVEIDPGVAFGHGGHPTTRLALEAMQRAVKESPTRRVVDLGTGTGVVAIIAAVLGARVEAWESDRGAYDVACTNVERNAATSFPQIQSLISVIHGDANSAEVLSDDIVVANVTLDVQKHLAPTCQPASHVVVSGIECRQVRDAIALYPKHRASTIRTSGEWACIEFSSIARFGRKNP